MDNGDTNKGEGRVAARGTVQLLLGRIYFMGMGYVIVVILARELGPVAYGTYGLIMSLLLWVEVASDFGIQRATIKLIPQSDDAQAVARTSAACLLTVTLLLFLACWFAAPFISNTFDLANGAWLFRLAVIDVPFNGIYIAYQGIMQGMRRFGNVAVALIVYSSAKLGGIAFLLLVGVSVEAALIVNVMATIAALAYLITRYRPGIGFGNAAAVKVLLGVAAPVGVYIVANRFILSSHLWSLKMMQGATDEAVGLYVAAWNVAQLPTVVTFVITGVLLASLSGAIAAGDSSLARRYLLSATRFLIVLLVPMCALGAIDARPIMELIFSSKFGDGGGYLALLLCAYGVFALLDVLVHALLAAGMQRRVAVVQLAWIPVALGLNGVLIPRYGGNGAAIALLVTLGFAVTTATIWVARFYGAPMLLVSAARVILAATVICGLSMFWTVSGVAVLAKLACLTLGYAGILWLLRELRSDDLRVLAFWQRP